jgi:hypothetical protein
MPGPILNFNKWRSINESKKSRFDSIYESATPPKTAAEITAFQTWVVYTKKDTTVLGKSGPKGDGVDGVMSAGGKTAAAWTQYGEEYLKDTGGKEDSDGQSLTKYTPTILKGMWQDSIANVKAKLEESQKTMVLMYFTRGEHQNCPACKELETNVFETSEFKNWAAQNMVLYMATVPLNPEIEKGLANKSEYSNIAKQLSVTSYPTVKIMEMTKSDKGAYSYSTKLTKSYNKESSMEWMKSISAYVKKIATPKEQSETFDKDDFDFIQTKMKGFRESLLKQIADHSALKNKNQDVFKNVDKIRMTLERMEDKLACDVKYNNFWKTTKNFLESKLKDKDTKLQQTERDTIVPEIIKSLDGIIRMCKYGVVTSNKDDMISKLTKYKNLLATKAKPSEAEKEVKQKVIALIQNLGKISDDKICDIDNLKEWNGTKEAMKKLALVGIEGHDDARTSAVDAIDKIIQTCRLDNSTVKDLGEIEIKTDKEKRSSTGGVELEGVDYQIERRGKKYEEEKARREKEKEKEGTTKFSRSMDKAGKGIVNFAKKRGIIS